MASYDVWLWPTVESVDEDELRRLLADWQFDEGYTDTAIARAAATTGHVEDRLLLHFSIWSCSCGIRFDNDLAAFVAHHRVVGCAELERLGYLPPGSADIAAALHAEDFPGSLHDLEVAVRGIMG